MVLKNKIVLGLISLFLAQVLNAQIHYFNSFDDTKIAYTMEGTGEPVLLVHGFIQNRKSWDKTVLKKELISRGYKVIVPDLRGNGDSDKPQKNTAYSDHAEVKDLIFLMNKLGFEKYKAIGYSRGSIVLAKLLTEDKKIEKAVLGGMGIDFTNPNWTRRLQFTDAFNGTTNEMTKGAVDYANSINADIKSLYLQQKFQPVTPVSELRNLEMKVLVIAGDQDLDNGNPQDLADVIPNAILKVVPGNHNETYKKEVFSKEVMEFIKD